MAQDESRTPPTEGDRSPLISEWPVEGIFFWGDDELGFLGEQHVSELRGALDHSDSLMPYFFIFLHRVVRGRARIWAARTLL